MAKAKYVNTRIQHKYDTKDNWANATFVPLAGELIIFAPDGDTPSATTATYPRFKVGDGNKAIGDLPLLDFVADFQAKEGTPGYIKNKPDIEAEVNNKISSLGLGDLAWKNKIDSTDCNFYIGNLAVKDLVSYYDLDADLQAKVDDNGGGGGGDMYKSEYASDTYGVVNRADYANNATNLYVGVDSDGQHVYVQGDSLFSEETQGTGIYYATRAIGANHALTAGHANSSDTVKFGDNYYGLTSFFTTQDGSFYADRALTAKHAESAETATTAGTANSADTAGNSLMLDGVPAANILVSNGFSSTSQVQSAAYADQANYATYFNSGGAPSGVTIAEFLDTLAGRITALENKIN